MISEVAIFIFGCVVTVFVGAAVALLLHGAAREKDYD